MLITVSLISHNRSDMTRLCLQHLEENTNRKDLEYILSDNASSDDNVEIFLNSKLKNKRLVQYGLNTGFNWPHREALKLARGSIFVVLNNDIFIKDTMWVDKIVEALQDPSVALVGVKGSASVLKSDGYGTFGDKVEYVEGSLMAGRTDLLREFGLFSPSLLFAYWEDSDVSLKYRQMGYQLKLVDIKHVHQRGATATTAKNFNREKIMTYNQRIFLARWQKYLQTRNFVNRVLVRANSLGIGDILCMTPVLEGIRKDHPMAEIEVDSPYPEIFMHNPHINAVYDVNRKHNLAYDRTIDLGLDYRRLDLIAKAACEKAATTIDSYRPQIFLQKAEIDEMLPLYDELKEDGKEITIIFAPQMSRTQWEGRNWSLEEATKLVNGLHELDEKIAVIEVGKDVPSTGKADIDLVDKLTLRQLFALISQASLFVGIDSLPLHVAQAFGIKSYALFGATEPIARITDFSTVVPIRRNDLVCIGCYHKPGAQPINKCGLSGQEVCMKGLTAQHVLDVMTEEYDSNEYTIKYLTDFIRRRDAA